MKPPVFQEVALGDGEWLSCSLHERVAAMMQIALPTGGGTAHRDPQADDGNLLVLGYG